MTLATLLFTPLEFFVRTEGADDRYGNPTVTWTNVGTFPAYFEVQAATETQGDETHSTQTGLVVVQPGSIDLAASMRFIAPDGLTWEIAGPGRDYYGLPGVVKTHEANAFLVTEGP